VEHKAQALVQLAGGYLTNMQAAIHVIPFLLHLFVAAASAAITTRHGSYMAVKHGVYCERGTSHGNVIISW
jgi:hypothetical protein